MSIIDIVKFNGLANGNWLIYKYYRDDLTVGGKIIVGEGQSVVFVKGGHIADVLNSGTHIIDSDNLPILRSILNIPFGGQTPFTAEVYFVNTTNKMDLTWGLSDPIQLVDPKYGIRIRVRGFGQVGVKVNKADVVVKELIGTMSQSEYIHYDKIISFFKGILITKIKTTLAQCIIDERVSALEISTKLELLSQKLCTSIQTDFDKFGLSLVNFNIQSINVPEEDLSKLTSILEQKATFDIIGDQRYAIQRSFDVYETSASNPNGIAGVAMAGGLGVGAGIGMMQGVQNINPINNLSQNKKCSKCGCEIRDNAKFCPECGNSTIQKKCSCGAILLPGIKFCPECGTKID